MTEGGFTCVHFRTATGKNITENFKDLLVVCRYRVPRRVITDNGTEFVNNVMKTMTQELGIQLLVSAQPGGETKSDTENVNTTVSGRPS